MVYTTQIIAVRCIHIPTREINCPKKNNAKLRFLSDMKMSEIFIRRLQN